MKSRKYWKANTVNKLIDIVNAVGLSLGYLFGAIMLYMMVIKLNDIGL